MLTERTGQVIVVLLALILGVLVFGKDAIAPWLIWAGIGLLAVGAVWLVLRGIFAIYGDDIDDELHRARRDGGSVLLVVIMFIGIFGNVAVLGWAAYVAWQSGIPFGAALMSIPFWYIPLGSFMACYGLNEGLKWLRRKQRSGGDEAS